MSYNLYWIPKYAKDEKYFSPTEKKFIGTYQSIEETRNAKRAKEPAFKNRKGAFFRSKVGESHKFTMVM
jgi:hypothetical protein